MEEKVLDRLADLFESVVKYLEKDTAEKYIKAWNEEIKRISNGYIIEKRSESWN